MLGAKHYIFFLKYILFKFLYYIFSNFINQNFKVESFDLSVMSPADCLRLHFQLPNSSGDGRLYLIVGVSLRYRYITVLASTTVALILTILFPPILHYYYTITYIAYPEYLLQQARQYSSIINRTYSFFCHENYYSIVEALT